MAGNFARFCAGLTGLIAALVSSAALAKTKADTHTCADRLIYAKSMSADWTVPGTIPHLMIVDGGTLTSLAVFEAVLGGASGTDRIAASDRGLLGQVVLVKGGDFSGWNFNDLDIPLKAVCFLNSKLAGSNWNAGNFIGIGFIDSDLTRATFREAKLGKIVLLNAILRDADMRDALLDEGRFSGGWHGDVTRWNLSGASMRHFTFDCGITFDDGCPLDRDGIDFSGADLTQADIATFATWGEADFRAAILDRTLIAPAQLRYINGAFAKGPVLLPARAGPIALEAPEYARLKAIISEQASQADDPSFPCIRARSVVEKLICSDYASRLRALDRDMAWAYARVRAADRLAPQAQQAWLRERDACSDQDCVIAAYQRRITALLGDLGDPLRLERGQSAYFIDTQISSAGDFRTDRLYIKIIPALIAGAKAAARITLDADGTYSVIGNAVGANAHICSLSGAGLTFDPESGWFSGPEDEGPDGAAVQGRSIPVFQLIGPQMTIINDGKPESLADAKSNPFVSCGARASFPTMQRLDYDSDRLASLVQFFDF